VRGGLNGAALATTRPEIAPLAGMERLNGPDRPPICVALSGGGDSLALLRLAKAWADGAGRSLVALTVDHQLQSAGAAWSRFAAARAARLTARRIVGDDQAVAVEHHALEARVRTHELAHLLAQKSGVTVGGQRIQTDPE